ncbi:MAG: YebC/PmpR family DNA-binding transcriptional regulator, partial [Gammaproteobacteria bacterium]
VISFAPGSDEDAIMEVAIEAGADDVITNDDGSIEVRTSPENFGPVQDALKAAGLEFANAEVTMLPSTEVALDKETAESVLKLVERLEDLDDTQNVYTNADFPEDVFTSAE